MTRVKAAARLRNTAGLTCDALLLEANDLDEALEAARRGERWAITVIYRAINPHLLRFLAHQASPVAEDLASETWLSISSMLPSFTGTTSEFRALVFTIARRRVIDYYRRIGRRPAQARLNEIEPRFVTADFSEAVVDRLTTEAAIEALVGMLPPKQAEVILLRVVADLSAEQIAQITGRTAGAVRILQHRALARILKALPPEA